MHCKILTHGVACVGHFGGTLRGGAGPDHGVKTGCLISVPDGGWWGVGGRWFLSLYSILRFPHTYPQNACC